MKLTPQTMKDHNEYLGYENHTFLCLRDFHIRYGLDFEEFLKNGLDVEHVKEKVGPNDPALNSVLEFIS